MTGEVRRLTTDPFERAARREEQEHIRQRWVQEMWGGRGSGMGAVIAFFGIPYVIWGLIRAAGFDFGDPTLPQSIVDYFFGKWWIFGAYTAWMLLLVWVWAIARIPRVKRRER